MLIPTFERPAALAVTLAGLAGQDERNFGVIVSDQSSKSVTERAEVAAMLRVLQRRGHPTRVHRHLPHRGMAEHRQFLLERASAPYVLFLDDDVYLEPETVGRLVRTMAEERCGFVGAFPTGLSFAGDRRPEVESLLEPWDGRVEPEDIEGSWERWRLHSAANPTHLYERFGALRYKVAWVGACVLYDREKLLDVGGFSWWRELTPEDVGEDILVQHLLRAKYGGAGSYRPARTTWRPRRRCPRGLTPGSTGCCGGTRTIFDRGTQEIWREMRGSAVDSLPLKRTSLCGMASSRYLGKEGFCEASELRADRARGAVQPALPNMLDPVSAGRLSPWAAGLHAVRHLYAPGRRVRRRMRPAPPGLSEPMMHPRFFDMVTCAAGKA